MTFAQVHKVIDAASELIVERLGDKGRHARTAIGCATLPNNNAVTLEAIARVAALVAADLRIDDRLADVALPDRTPGHVEHPLERHAGAVHDLRRKLDPRLEVAQRDVELLERVERHVRAHVAVAVAVAARDADEGLVRRRLLHLVDDVRLGRDEDRLRPGELEREVEDRLGRADMVGMVDDVRRAFGMRRDRSVRDVRP